MDRSGVHRRFQPNSRIFWAAASMNDVAASLSKKRRRDDPQSPASRDVSGGDGASLVLDLISSLPDEILGTIISLLPTKDAARTTALSSRWRYLWRSAPLNLAVDYLVGHIWRTASFNRDVDYKPVYRQLSERIAVIVSKILAAHNGPARRLSFGDHHGIRLSRDLCAKFDGWFWSPVLDGLEELDFYLGDNSWWTLPPSVFRFMPTLRVVRLCGCDFHEIKVTPRTSSPSAEGAQALWCRYLGGDPPLPARCLHCAREPSA
ncbi:F-box/LRR-repeat protein At3g59190 isoform X1 [Triticum aestivum]|uniref:F-box/LRR-repeat protein At3g59190 isoform X1 n=1 Tax=Triticum aestivum TaxID=4565 RepID=UPI001D021F3F|nr:F-box/LRR-repeat protein At3g59190-like isoform X1 [Triticum aestivum]